MFCCPQCKTNLDRDINGARNILLRYITKKESAQADAGAYSLTGLVIPNLLVMIGFNIGVKTQRQYNRDVIQKNQRKPLENY